MGKEQINGNKITAGKKYKKVNMVSRIKKNIIKRKLKFRSK